MDGWTDRRIDGHIYMEIHRYIDRQLDRHTDGRIETKYVYMPRGISTYI